LINSSAFAKRFLATHVCPKAGHLNRGSSWFHLYKFIDSEEVNPQLFEAPKQKKEGEVEEEKLGTVVRGYVFSAEREEFSSRLCLIVLLVKVACKKVRTLRRKRGEGLGSGQFFLWSREGGAEPVGGT
jgi:hypothetical protein